MERINDANQAVGVDELFRFGDADTFSELNIGEKQAVQLLSHDLRGVSLAVTSTLRSFARPPGRRVMMLVSGGWPFDPIRHILSREAKSVAAQGTVSGREIYAPILGAANRLGYSLYTIDAPGMQADSEIAKATFVDQGTQGRAQRLDRESNNESTLTYLADETGGMAFLNNDREFALEDVMRDTRSYYWLGITPQWKGDGQDHDIRVRVLPAGLKSRSRRGYSDLSRQSEVTMMVESSLLFGNPPGSEPLAVKIGRQESAGSGRILLPIEVIVPMDMMTFLPHAEGFVAATELRIAVLDENGNRNETPVIPLDIVLDEMPEPGARRTYSTNVKLRKKRHDVLVALYDNATGGIYSTRIEVAP